MKNFTTKTLLLLIVGFTIVASISLLPSCAKKDKPSLYDTILSTTQIDTFQLYRPKTMVWNDTGIVRYWSRCWIHNLTYTSTGQLSKIFVKIFDSDSATSKPDSMFYTLTYADSLSIYPTHYTFKYYGAGRGLLSNDVHTVISNQQVVYLDSAKALITYPGGNIIDTRRYTYYNGKTTIKRSDFKDSIEYIITNSMLQQINDYAQPIYLLSNQSLYTYPNGTSQWINPFWYVKVHKYLFGNSFNSVAKYLPVASSDVYINSPNYNLASTFTYVSDALGRVIIEKSQNQREKTTTVYSY